MHGIIRLRATSRMLGKVSGVVADMEKAVSHMATLRGIWYPVMSAESKDLIR